MLLGQVYFHLSVRRQDGEMLQTTRADEGGTGVPEAYVLNGKGRRALRGWELALLGVPQNATPAYQGKGGCCTHLHGFNMTSRPRCNYSSA